MRVVQLDSFEQIRDYGTSWNDLVNVSQDNHIFLTLEWLDTWWKYFGANRQLDLLAVEDDHRLLAVAPLMNSSYKLFGLKLRNVEFIGTPNSDYNSFILTEESSACARMLLNHINNHSWDCVELKNIQEDSETAHAIKAITSQSLKLKERVSDICSFVPLPSTTEEYFKRLSPKFKQNLRRWERNLAKGRKVEFVNYNQIGSVEEAMNIFFRLHQKRWESKGSEGKFADQKLRDFHMELAKRFDEKGWLRLVFLTVSSEPISAEYCFEYKWKKWAYLSGFNPYYAKYSVGNLGVFHLITDSIKRGLKEVDLMRGEYSYKDRFAGEVRRNIELSFVRWKPIGKAYEWLVKSNLVPSMSRRLQRRALSGKMYS